MKRYCKGCGLCVEACERGKIHIDPRPNRQGVQTAVLDEGIHCTGCLKCATICPDAAVEIYQRQPPGCSRSTSAPRNKPSADACPKD